MKVTGQGLEGDGGGVSKAMDLRRGRGGAQKREKTKAVRVLGMQRA